STQQLLIHLVHAQQIFKQPLPLNPALIAQTRLFLTNRPSLQLSILILKNMDDHSSLVDINLGMTTPTPLFTSKTITSQIPTLFTAKAFTMVFAEKLAQAAQETLQGNWVLGNITTSNTNLQDFYQLTEQLRTYYLYHYVKTWENIVTHLHLVTPKDLTAVDALLVTLTNTPSPLLQTLQTIYENIYFEPIIAMSPSLQNLSIVLNEMHANTPNSLLSEIFSGLNAVHHYLHAILSAKDIDQASSQAIEKRMQHTGTPDAITQLRFIAEKSPQPIRQWLDQITDVTWQLLMDNANGYLNTAENEHSFIKI
ncbi:MAG TPA: ImcF-related family protein, partial [Gammaproteobacteria bacterium]|nr:ImcF-related family protein [Gammaproteobacteria bacterium]